MPEIQAFRGLRYDLGHVGSLSDVVAPPYDVIGPRACRTSSTSGIRRTSIRLDSIATSRAMTTTNNRYTRAAQFLKNWRSEGVLFAESRPAIYVYHQQFTPAGRTFTRRGFMARCRLCAFRRGEHLPARRDDVRAEAGPPAAHPAPQGQPEPDLWPLSRPGRTKPRTCLERAVAGRRPARGDRPSGRRPSPVARHRLSPDRRRRRRDRAPSRSSSPTAITAMKPPATTATSWRPSRPARRRTTRPISC